MKEVKMTLTAFAILFAMVAFHTAAQATTLRAFVSSTGSDGNVGVNCPQATPCRTFNAAFPTVTAGGELIALDTAGYGPITNINKAITVAALPGNTAFVVAAAGTAAFTVNGGPSDLIILRNLSFNGSGAANTTGVQDNSGKLVIDNCKFAQLTTGLNVVNAKVDVFFSDFLGNGTGISCDGAGTEAFNSMTVSSAQVRLNGGNVTGNTTGIIQKNPGSGKNNVFSFTSGNSGSTNVVGNVTDRACTGGGCSASVTTFSLSSNPLL
jgi:hypothetical protein